MVYSPISNIYKCNKKHAFGIIIFYVPLQIKREMVLKPRIIIIRYLQCIWFTLQHICRQQTNCCAFSKQTTSVSSSAIITDIFRVVCGFDPGNAWHKYKTNVDIITINRPYGVHKISTRLAVSYIHTVYPKKYAHGFVVLCFVVVMQSFIMNSHEVFIHIHQGCFAGTGAIVRLPQCQQSKPGGYRKISQCITTTKHSKAKTVCIFLGIYCIICIHINIAI